MPLYEYRCQACDHRFEILQPIGASADGIACPACAHDEVRKQHSTFAASTGSAPAPATAAAGCCMGAAA